MPSLSRQWWRPAGNRILKEAKDAEIPVFLLDRSIDVKDKSLYMTTVTANNVLEGQLIGDWLVKQVDGKPCNVVELQGTVGASVAIDRKKGFAEAIAKAPNIKIIRSQSGDFTRSKGKEVMESFIKAENNGKNICMVYAHNDDMVIGAIQAIKEAGLKPGKDILRRLYRRCAGYLQSDDRRRSQRQRRTDAKYGGSGI